VRLLDARCFDLRQTANDLLRSIWENLIVVNYDNREITINKELDGEFEVDLKFDIANHSQEKQLT
jgi:hypothetical protein